MVHTEASEGVIEPDVQVLVRARETAPSDATSRGPQDRVRLKARQAEFLRQWKLLQCDNLTFATFYDYHTVNDTSKQLDIFSFTKKKNGECGILCAGVWACILMGYC